ncbi:uncharacterized protein [Ptychodera flava]
MDGLDLHMMNEKMAARGEREQDIPTNRQREKPLMYTPTMFPKLVDPSRIAMLSTAEERALAIWCKEMARKDVELTPQNVIEAANSLMQRKMRDVDEKKPLKIPRPADNLWFNGFQDRYKKFNLGIGSLHREKNAEKPGKHGTEDEEIGLDMFSCNEFCELEQTEIGSLLFIRNSMIVRCHEFEITPPRQLKMCVQTEKGDRNGMMVWIPAFSAIRPTEIRMELVHKKAELRLRDVADMPIGYAPQIINKALRKTITDELATRITCKVTGGLRPSIIPWRSTHHGRLVLPADYCIHVAPGRERDTQRMVEQFVKFCSMTRNTLKWLMDNTVDC